MTEASPLVVLSTIGDHASAERLAATVVAAELAACVNILPGVTSVFRWAPEGADAPGVQSEEEVMLIMKTSAAAYPALERHLQYEHPYDVPEIIAWPIAQGSPAFCQWIGASTRGATDDS